MPCQIIQVESDGKSACLCETTVTCQLELMFSVQLKPLQLLALITHTLKISTYLLNG